MCSEARLTPRLTADGSYTFYSQDFGECFHSHHGAYQEAQGKFVVPTRLSLLAHRRHLRLLDICYGLGYNSAAALEQIWQVNAHCQVQLVALELDLTVPQQTAAQGWLQHWSPVVQSHLLQLAQQQQVITPTLEAHLYLGDARQTLQTVLGQGFKADAIFLDPFSPPHCPQLWTVDFFSLLYQCLSSDARLATYSCAAAVRTGLRAAGFQIGASHPVGRRTSGTIASHSPLEGYPLSPQELEHLQTKAAVPYRDPDLSDPAEVILGRRQQEQMNAPLLPTKQWKKKWMRRA